MSLKFYWNIADSGTITIVICVSIFLGHEQITSRVKLAVYRLHVTSYRHSAVISHTLRRLCNMFLSNSSFGLIMNRCDNIDEAPISVF